MAEPTGWEPVPRSRTFELVLDRIEEQILAGKLRVGDRLPPERELVELLGVSRAAIREALRVLEAQGVVRAKVGTGRDSGSVITALPSAGLTQLLRFHMALANFPLPDVVDTRAALERASARSAAGQASEQQLSRLYELLVLMDDPALSREEFSEHDVAFHVTIAEAGGNRLMADLTVAVRNAVRHPLLAAFRRLDDWPAVAADLRAEHHAIYQAIAAGDAQAAGDLVESHIHRFYHEVALPALPADTES
ncbi:MULTISPECIES: FadR/GntR family transcriptional regulator [Kitasatospora]|uniref:FadR/GntR family transcriptional regulator n=1 Tax=Kitasatospora TaxID=2063 RepID=UPI000CA76ED3|nr:FCD domain-containing protein [Kitasatospora sp. GP30]MDH6142912.1 GntR family transcriptional repressor for pyruvate dehydrogenase complex [Kitasatospora sp. GP30]